MKIIDKIYFMLLGCITILLVISCKKVITDFGNDSTISGTVKDASGNIVAGDITSTYLIVKALGEGDIVTTDMRVRGDGTFQNTKLFPVKYRVWISGPVTPTEDTIYMDFSIDKKGVHDFIVTPFLTLAKPSVFSDPTATTVNISYQIIANSGKTVSKRQLYCSTSPYPNASTGSGPFYKTITVTLSNNSGNTVVTGLVTGTKYYIRIGAQATGAVGYNYSDQIEITTL